MNYSRINIWMTTIPKHIYMGLIMRSLNLNHSIAVIFFLVISNAGLASAFESLNTPPLPYLDNNNTVFDTASFEQMADKKFIHNIFIFTTDTDQEFFGSINEEELTRFIKFDLNPASLDQENITSSQEYHQEIINVSRHNHNSVNGLSSFGSIVDFSHQNHSRPLDKYPHVTSPVPEPETYAMVLAGLGLIIFTARRRKING